MPEKVWKQHERRVASKLGGQRVVCSGVRGEGDIEHPELYVECKYRKSFVAKGWFNETKRKAKKYNKTPILVVKEKGQKGSLAILSTDDLAELVRRFYG
jgi:uncharacterized Zn-finger protein